MVTPMRTKALMLAGFAAAGIWASAPRISRTPQPGPDPTRMEFGGTALSERFSAAEATAAGPLLAWGKKSRDKTRERRDTAFGDTLKQDTLKRDTVWMPRDSMPFTPPIPGETGLPGY